MKKLLVFLAALAISLTSASALAAYASCDEGTGSWTLTDSNGHVDTFQFNHLSTGRDVNGTVWLWDYTHGQLCQWPTTGTYFHNPPGDLIPSLAGWTLSMGNPTPANCGTNIYAGSTMVVGGAGCMRMDPAGGQQGFTYTRSTCDTPPTSNGEQASSYDSAVGWEYAQAPNGDGTSPAAPFHAKLQPDINDTLFSFNGRSTHETLGQLQTGTGQCRPLFPNWPPAAATWNVDSDQWSVGSAVSGDDYIGWKAGAVNYINSVRTNLAQTLPCDMTWSQTMSIDCLNPSTQLSYTVPYQVSTLKITIGTTQIQVFRNGAASPLLTIGKSRADAIASQLVMPYRTPGGKTGVMPF